MPHFNVSSDCVDIQDLRKLAFSALNSCEAIAREHLTVENVEEVLSFASRKKNDWLVDLCKQFKASRSSHSSPMVPASSTPATPSNSGSKAANSGTTSSESEKTKPNEVK